MTLLFRRAAIITAGTVRVEHGFGKASLSISFSVERSLKPEPNTAEIQIWNMNADNRSKLEEPQGGKIPVEIEAGYEEQTTLLFSGIMRTAYTTREGPDLITTLQTGDGEKQYKQSRINLTIAKGTPNAVVLRQAVNAMGIGQGNLASAVPSLVGVPLLFPQGGVLSGSAAQIVTRITKAFGLEWSIQDSSFQILRAGKPLTASAIKLTPETGLIGSPSVDNEGVLTAQALLIPDIFPGRLMVLESERLSGNYRIERCNYSGTIPGSDWYVDLEAKKLG